MVSAHYFRVNMKINFARFCDDTFDMIPPIHEAMKQKRAWQTCCVPQCQNTNLNRSMFHLPKVVRKVKKQEVINEENLIRYGKMI